MEVNILKHLGFTDSEIENFSSLPDEKRRELIDSKIRQIAARAEEPLRQEIEDLKQEMSVIGKRSDEEAEQRIADLSKQLDRVNRRRIKERIQADVMREYGITDIPGLAVFDAVMDKHYDIGENGETSVRESIADLDMMFVTSNYRNGLTRWITGQVRPKQTVGNTDAAYLRERDLQERAKRLLRDRHYTRNLSPEQYDNLSRQAGIVVSDLLVDKLKPRL